MKTNNNSWQQIWDKFSTITIAVLLSVAMQACVIVGESYVIEESFTEDKLPSIHDGKVTQRDLLQWFGPPKIVARNKDFITAQQQIKLEDISESFKASSVRAQKPLLYYYENRTIRNTALGAMDTGTSSGFNTGPLSAGKANIVKKLWILIDENNGLAMDYILINGQ